MENVAQSQLEIDKVELETELVPMDHNAIVITTVSRFETAEHARIDISHPYVYSEANSKLGDAVEAAIGSIFTKRHAEADKTLRTAQSCTYHRTSAHTEHAYMTHVYATDTVLCMNISTGYYVCSIGHQCTTTRSYVFDIATGKRLNLADMLDPANPNAKKDFQAVMTQICKEKNLPCNASKMFNLANKYDQNTNWYLLNDGIYMDYEFISSGYQGFFIPYEQLVGILRPDCLPMENIGSAQVKAVRIENILDDYDGQLIYGDYGTSSTGVQLDGLVSHIWVNDRAYDPNTARGRYFYGYKVKDVTVMLPPHEDSVGVVWTDYLGDHFATLEPLPEPEPAEDEYLP